MTSRLVNIAVEGLVRGGGLMQCCGGPQRQHCHSEGNPEANDHKETADIERQTKSPVEAKQTDDAIPIILSLPVTMRGAQESWYGVQKPRQFTDKELPVRLHKFTKFAESGSCAKESQFPTE